VVEGERFPKGRNSEDILYTTRAMVKAAGCVFLDTPYYNYIVDRADSIMNNRLHERRFGDEIPFLREQERYLLEKGMKELAEKAAYHFYRRMLFYYIDFCDRKMRKSARQLIHMLRAEKQNIRLIYRQGYVAGGDRVRMKTALTFPGLYYCLVKLYDRVIIPLRQRR
jgi:hypothetical protein